MKPDPIKNVFGFKITHSSSDFRQIFMFLDIYFNKSYKEAINLLDLRALQKVRIKAHERVF